MTNTHSPAALLEAYYAVEQTRDVARVLDLYADDAVFGTPAGEFRSRSEIVAFYADSVARFPGLLVRLKTVLGDDTIAVAEWEATLIDNEGASLELIGVNVAEFAEDRIVRMRAYFDAGAYATS